MAVVGKEDDVPWIWSNSLTIHVGGINVPTHEIHGLSVSIMGGNQFYGSFSIVSKEGKLYQHPKYLDATPTLAQHTEPQYFTWLIEELDDVPLSFMHPSAFILEINQTNTPCSKQSCRKAIINAVKNGNLFGAAKITVARMAAYQIYETQYPKVCPTSMEIAAGQKESDTTQILIAASTCLHRFPQKK
jgi:hypothetical protein